MKLGEIVVLSPCQPGLPWRARALLDQALAKCSAHTDQNEDGQLVVLGEGADAALAIKDLWKNIGRAYLGLVAERLARDAKRHTKAELWDAIHRYANALVQAGVSFPANATVTADLERLINELELDP